MATLHQNVIKNLEVFYGNKPVPTQVINTIQNSLELVSMLNLFNNRKGTFKWLKQGEGAHYDGSNKLNPIIAISPDDFSGDYFYLTLAHELGHATGLSQAKYISNAEIKSGIPKTYTHALTYSDTRRQGEGEAIFKEYVVAKELNMIQTFTNWKGTNITNILNDNSTTKKQKIDAISKFNYYMKPSGQGSHSIIYTYDEKDIAWFMSTFTNINTDYKEVMKNDFLSNRYHVQSVSNRHNRFFIHEQTDTNKAHDVFTNSKGLNTIAQKNNQHDLMYGGRGNDTITGAAGKEIILGGDGVDKLYGMGGDDILGGNIGDDHLYGGTGNDTLKGGQGMDTYYFEANDINNPKERDTINDSDNQGKILISNVDIAKAKWINKGNGIWQAADQKWQLKQVGSNWEITGMNGSSLKSTIIVQNATKTVNAFGLTLPKAATAAPRVAMATEHAFLANSISAANNLISAMSAFGADNMGIADDLNARSTQYHAPLLAASAI